VGEVETLSTHFSANATSFDLEYEISKGGVCKVEVPHVLESALVDLTGAGGPPNRTSEGIATIRNARHLLHNLQGTV